MFIYELRRQLFLPEDCSGIAKSLLESSEGWGRGIAGDAYNPDTRRSDVAWPSREHRAVRRLDDCVRAIAARWRIELNPRGAEFQLGRYTAKDQGAYHAHRDAYPNREQVHRKVSASVLLSDPADFTGGRFEFTDFSGGALDLAQGDCVVFSSFMPHRVLPVIRGERLSLVSWVSGPTWT